MNSPQRYVIRMALFLAAVVILCVILIEPLQRAFAANFGLNGLIVGVLILGIAYNFRQVLRLNPEVHWIESFRRAGPAISETRQPKLLAPMATMLGERDDTLSLSTLSMRSLLDGIASRLDEARELSRYTIGLLIFLGLLGTFWGLLQTIGSISDVIGGLTVGGGDVTTVFNSLKSGLVVPLSGMGTAFSSSLFGLAGSLVLGFLDLQAGQASNRFYNDLEEWLSSLTRLSSGGLSAEGDQSVPAYVQALLEHTAEHQVQLRATLEKLADPGRTGSAGLDEATQAHIRNLDIYVARLLEEISAGRDDLIGQVRSEIKLLARTIAAGAASSRAAPPAPKK